MHYLTRSRNISGRQTICDLDELILECTFYSWTEALLNVGQLRRSGNCVTVQEGGEYTPSHFPGLHI
jgi:hypothetical protein